MDVLHVPVVLHEFDGEPVEEFGVGWTRALEAEIFGSFEETDAEVGLPDAVDEGAGGGG